MSSSGIIYYTGTVQFNLSSNESSYVTSTLTIASNTSSPLILTFDTTGLSTFSFNFATLAPGAYNVTYTVINPNGLESQSSVMVYTQRANTVTFEESGLAPGMAWSVTFNGVQQSSTTSTISFNNIAIGNYTYTVSSIAGYRAVPSGTVTVSGNSTVQISFVAIPTSFIVTFTESGLSSGTTWSVTFNGVQQSSTTSTISFNNIPIGNYAYTVSSIAGYRAVPSGTVTVSGNSTVQISFVAVPTSFTVTFTESGLSSGTTWSVTFNGVHHSSATSTIVITGVAAGTYSYTIQNVSGYTVPGTSTITVNGNSSVNVMFTKTPSEWSTLLPWIIVIILVIAVIVVAIAYARKPKNAKVIQTPEEENPPKQNP